VPSHILQPCLADNRQWLGLCITSSFPLFLALSFITAVSTVTPQLMLPLVGDLAPPHRRATALSIVVSGLLLGMLLARLLSGVLTQYTSWRSIYFLSLGLQYVIFILLWLFMPDYPSTNPGGLNYFSMLWSMVTMLWNEPILVQACVVGFLTSTTFTSFWTTLTFLLAGEPYNYSPLTIGLFALIGIAAMAFGPFYCNATRT
jgi:predicted MFS family arabinose efflux permease